MSVSMIGGELHLCVPAKTPMSRSPLSSRLLFVCPAMDSWALWLFIRNLCVN